MGGFSASSRQSSVFINFFFVLVGCVGDRRLGEARLVTWDGKRKSWRTLVRMFISPVSSEQVKKETAFPGRRRFEDGGRWSWGPPAAGDLNQTATTKSSANLGAAPILLIRVSCLQLHDQAAPARPHQLQREAGSLRHMVATGVGMIQVWTSLARLRLISDASPNDVASKTRPFFPPSFYLLRAESLQRAHGFPFGKQSRPARPEETNGEAVTLPERQNVLGMFLAVGKSLQEPKSALPFSPGRSSGRRLFPRLRSKSAPVGLFGGSKSKARIRRRWQFILSSTITSPLAKWCIIPVSKSWEQFTASSTHIRLF